MWKERKKGEKETAQNWDDSISPSPPPPPPQDGWSVVWWDTVELLIMYRLGMLSMYYWKCWVCTKWICCVRLACGIVEYVSSRNVDFVSVSPTWCVSYVSVLCLSHDIVPLTGVFLLPTFLIGVYFLRDPFHSVLTSWMVRVSTWSMCCCVGDKWEISWFVHLWMVVWRGMDGICTVFCMILWQMWRVQLGNRLIGRVWLFLYCIFYTLKVFTLFLCLD